MRLGNLWCVVLAVGAMPATAYAWGAPQTLGRTSGGEAPVVAGNASGRVAVGWLGRQTMEVRVSDGGQQFGPVQPVRGVGPNISPNDAQMAMGPDGTVVLAWHNLIEASDDFEQCCSYWRLTIRRGGRFTRSRVLSSRSSQSDDLRFAFDRRGRPWVAWDENGERFYVARISQSGRFVDRRLVRSPDLDTVVDLVDLRVRSGAPELVLRVPRGEFEDDTALVSVRATRPPGRTHDLLVTGSMNSADVLGFDTPRTPRLLVWDNNEDAVLTAARRGPRFGHETAVVRRRRSGLLYYSLATNADGAGLLGVVIDPLGKRAGVRVSFATGTSRLSKGHGVGPANADGSPPIALLDNAGRGDLAWRTTDRRIAIQSYRNRTPIGRVLITSRGTAAECDDVDCPAATGATFGARGAIFAWLDGRRIRVLRRSG